MGRSKFSKTVAVSQSHGHDIDPATVSLVLEFQQTGRGFEPMWAGIGPTVQGMLRCYLRKRSVKDLRGGADETAVDETSQAVMTSLWELPSKGPKAWFDPGRKHSAAEALRAWLSGFCHYAVARYCRTWRGVGRKRKVLTESALPVSDQALNQMSGQTEYSSILKSAVVKMNPLIEIQDREFAQIVNECVEALPDEELRTLIRLNVWEELSVRALEQRLGIDESSVQRRVTKTRKLLRKELERRGVDASCLDSHSCH